MTRKPPTTMPPMQVNQQQKTNFITETRRYKLITPLYGGGVEPNNADPITVVRVSEVRGHLRFWWRATCGGTFGGNLNAMRGREEEIWGSAGGTNKPRPSKVLVVVKESKAGLKNFPFEVAQRDNNKRQVKPRQGSKVPPYVAFPLQPKQENLKVGMQTDAVLDGVSFSLEITYHNDDSIDVAAALWAWETFGGIGARTRRGFGALERIDSNSPPAPRSDGIKKWLEENLAAHIVNSGKWPKGVPHLSPNHTSYKITAPKKNGISAWNHIINALQNFRQKDARYDKQTGKKKEHGQSRWPEANEIRRIFKLEQIVPEGVSKNTLVQKFPRAQFGLPIIFHMPHDKDLPDNITLQGVEKSQDDKFDRLASPLILRPIACKDDAVGLAVILDCPRTPPGGLILKGAPNNPNVESKVEPQEVQYIPPLKNENEADVLKAFLKFLK